jgi:hypothetical protein
VVKARAQGKGPYHQVGDQVRFCIVLVFFTRCNSIVTGGGGFSWYSVISRFRLNCWN